MVVGGFRVGLQPATTAARSASIAPRHGHRHVRNDSAAPPHRFTSSLPPPPCRCRRGGRSILRIQAIGFDLPGAETSNKSAEKSAEELCRGAASLLLYTAALRGKPAQAFLGVLQLLQKGSPLALVQQYGELYRQLAADDYASWQDYLLDQVIKGSDNPLARLAGHGKPTAHLHAAAAHDLDVLQRLAVLERTLASWIKDTAYGVSDEWLEAAASLAPRGAQGEAAPLAPALLDGAPAPAALLGPLTTAQRAGLRAELAGKWRWSEGVELLVSYHASHGCGLVSQHSVLTWVGRLQAQDVLKGAHELAAAEAAGLVGPGHHAANALTVALTDFLQKDPQDPSAPPHTAICGPAAARWLYLAWALQRLDSQVPAELHAAAGGLHTLVLPASQLSSLADLAWSLSQHPRARFAVVVTSMEGGMNVGDLAALLSGWDGFSWPRNAMLLGGFKDKPPAELAPVFRHVATIEDKPKEEA